MELAGQLFGQSHSLRDWSSIDSAASAFQHQPRSCQRRRHHAQVCAATTLLRENKVADVSAERDAATNQVIREGHFEADLVDRQVSCLDYGLSFGPTFRQPM